MSQTRLVERVAEDVDPYWFAVVVPSEVDKAFLRFLASLREGGVIRLSDDGRSMRAEAIKVPWSATGE